MQKVTNLLSIDKETIDTFQESTQMGSMIQSSGSPSNNFYVEILSFLE